MHKKYSLMRRCFAFLYVFILFFVTSCKEDGGSQTVNTDVAITGTWYAKKIIIGGLLTPSSISIPVPFNQERDNECTQESTLTLNEDESGQMILKDDTFGTCSEILNQTFTYVYNKDAQTLQVTQNGISELGNIEELTNNSLILKRELENFDVQGNSFTGTITVEFKK